jgi:hypothetical protein
MAQACVRFTGQAFHERCREPRFSNPGLTGHRDTWPSPVFALASAPQQQFEFFLPPNKGGVFCLAMAVKFCAPSVKRPRTPQIVARNLRATCQLEYLGHPKAILRRI